MSVDQPSNLADGFRYQSVKLLRDKPLGSGSYGSVCRAMCDDLPCAAKILHAVFFRIGGPGTEDLMRRFQQECEVMSRIRHPHIVQCFGTYQDPELGLPILLMELMEDSLTHFLERVSLSLPYHVQVDLSHDVALALSYLHTCGIIHRDLSSNNVLLIAGRRAKITDFGMAKLVDTNSRMTPLTQCPGTEVYMSPEARRTPPVYTHKLDCFCFGVLVIQILTHLFPDPGPARNTIRDPRYPTGTIEVPVPEVERRKKHINLIEEENPLLHVALLCLKDEEADRPRASEICQSLLELEEQEDYAVSVKEGDNRSPSTQRSSHASTETKPYSSETQDSFQATGTKPEEILSLTEELHKSQDTAAKKQLELEKQLKEKDREIDELRRVLQAMKPQEVSRSLSAEERTTIASLKWQEAPKAPCEMRRGAVASDPTGSVAYFSSVGSSEIYSFIVEEETWSRVEPDCPTELFTLTVVNGFLTTVGGFKNGEVKSEVYSLIDGKSGKKWKQKYPPMLAKRLAAGVACYKQYLIVAGGRQSLVGTTKLLTVEILDTTGHQWSAAVGLCDPVAGLRMCVCGDDLYIGGGNEDQSRSVGILLHCSIPVLLKTSKTTKFFLSPFKYGSRSDSGSASDSPVWRCVSTPSFDPSGCVYLCGQLVALAFHSEVLAEKTIVCLYNRKSGSWTNVSKVPTERSSSLAVAIAGNRLMVVGGYSHNTSTLTDTAEIGTPE